MFRIMASFFILFFLVFEVSQFVRFIKRFDVINEQSEKIDAVITLAGGKGRIQSGVDLCEQFKPKLCLLSGVDKTFDEKSYFKAHKLNYVENLKVERKSQSTLENALEAEKFIRDYSIQNILLVTSNYHMYRAHYIFQKIMPRTVNIYSHSLETPRFEAHYWYTKMASISITFREFIKYQWSSLLLFILSSDSI
ncbi:MAG: YdcF family protein [Deltaproteobacteria bacterium]|nr:YdcF family protein [Deltaproteobacteria bacterium]